VPDFLISTTQSTAEAGDGMELSLQTYFDLGVSYGLGDSAFAPLQDLQGQTVPDILGIGISNPLGLGRTGQLTDATVSLWRQASVDKVDAPEMELGFEGSTAEFPDAPATFEEYKSSLKSLIATHAINTRQVTVYAIGVVFLRLDFVVGVPLPLANGLRREPASRRCPGDRRPRSRPMTRAIASYACFLDLLALPSARTQPMTLTRSNNVCCRSHPMVRYHPSTCWSSSITASSISIGAYASFSPGILTSLTNRLNVRSAAC
jgi:hypothetical protein